MGRSTEKTRVGTRARGGKAPNVATITADIMRRTNTTTGLRRAAVFWPNIEPLIDRLVRRIGTEITLPGDGELLVDRSFTAAYRGMVAYEGGDGRDGPEYLLSLVDGFVSEAVRIAGFDVRCNDVLWDPLEQDFLVWRSDLDGDLSVTRSSRSPSAVDRLGVHVAEYLLGELPHSFEEVAGWLSKRNAP